MSAFDEMQKSADDLLRKGRELTAQWAAEEAQAQAKRDEDDRVFRARYPDYTPQKGVARKQCAAWILGCGTAGATTSQFAEHFDITEPIAVELLELHEANEISGFSKWSPLTRVDGRWVHYENLVS